MATDRNTTRDEFPAVLGRCLLGIVIAIALGCFIGYGLLMMIGQESDLTITNRYLDRAALSRSGFVEQNLEYQQAADVLRTYPGIKVLRTGSGAPLYWLDGAQVDPASLMDESFVTAIETLFTGSNAALSGESAVTQEEITDLQLYNIAVDPDGNVYYYLYYDALGFLCIIYDGTSTYAENEKAIALMEQWYLYFDYGELDT